MIIIIILIGFPVTTENHLALKDVRRERKQLHQAFAFISLRERPQDEEDECGDESLKDTAALKRTVSMRPPAFHAFSTASLCLSAIRFPAESHRFLIFFVFSDFKGGITARRSSRRH